MTLFCSRSNSKCFFEFNLRIRSRLPSPHSPSIHHQSYLSSKSSNHLLSKTYHDPDHQYLRSIFDSHHSTQPQSASIHPSGLFNYSQLKSPDQLLWRAKTTVRRCGLIVNRICASFSPQLVNSSTPIHDPIEAFVKCVGMFDRLSDGLCRIIDLAELIRNLHPDPDWVSAADRAHDLLCRYMNTLNTHPQLYSVRNSVSFVSSPHHLLFHRSLEAHHFPFIPVTPSCSGF